MGHRGTEKPLVIFRNLPVVLRHLRGDRPRAEVASGSGIAAEHLALLEYRPGRPLPKMTCRLQTLDALLRHYQVDLARLSELLAAAEGGNLDTSFRQTRRKIPKNEAKGEADMKDVKKLRATPMEMELEASTEGEDSYPDGHWVWASTNLIFPSKLLYPDENLDDEIYCALLSPGRQVGGKAGGDQDSAFQTEALVLTRMLMHLGIIISE